MARAGDVFKVFENMRCRWLMGQALAKKDRGKPGQSGPRRLVPPLPPVMRRDCLSALGRPCPDRRSEVASSSAISRRHITSLPPRGLRPSTTSEPIVGSSKQTGGARRAAPPLRRSVKLDRGLPSDVNFTVVTADLDPDWEEKMRFIGTLLAVLVGVFGLGLGDAAASPKGKRVAHLTTMASHPFIAELSKAMTQRAEELGYKVTTFSTPFDAALQARQLDDAVARKFDRVVVSHFEAPYHQPAAPWSSALHDIRADCWLFEANRWGTSCRSAASKVG